MIDQEKIVRPNELAKVYRVAPSTVWRWVQNGTIPKPRKLGGVVYWLASDVQKMLQGEAS